MISLTAWRSEGYFHTDEHFQLLEYAQYKVDGLGKENLAWEYEAQLRPGLQVFVAATLIQISNFVGLENPFHIAFLLRLLSGFLALWALAQLGAALFKEDEKQLRLFTLLSGLIWFMPYQLVRFSSENWSAIFILFSLSSMFNKKHFLWVGLFAGIAFSFRYQSAFFIAGQGFWLLFIKKEKFKNIVLLVLGFAAALGISALSDLWLYGTWAFPAYNYFYVNLIEGKAAEFGTEPFYYYLIKISESGILPIGMLIIAAYAIFIVHFRKNIITWVSLPFFLIHCLISHKELRFLFPLVYFIPYVLVLVYQNLKVKKHPLFQKFIYTLVIVNLLILPFSSFKPSNPRISLLKHLYKKEVHAVCYLENPYFDVHWYRFYFPQKFNPKTLNTVNKLDSQMNYSSVIVRHYKSPESINGPYEYRQIPEWVENFNYFNWLNRSNTWCIIQVDR